MTTNEKSWYNECLGRLMIRELIKNGQLNEKALLDEKLAEKLGSYTPTIEEVK